MLVLFICIFFLLMPLVIIRYFIKYSFKEKISIDLVLTILVLSPILGFVCSIPAFWMLMLDMFNSDNRCATAATGLFVLGPFISTIGGIGLLVFYKLLAKHSD